VPSNSTEGTSPLGHDQSNECVHSFFSCAFAEHSRDARCATEQVREDDLSECLILLPTCSESAFDDLTFAILVRAF
jgi:hypothetical protein